MRNWLVAVAVAAATGAGAAPQFTDDERARVVAFWQEPGRYVTAAPPEASRLGPWRAGLTVPGSTWFLVYQRALGSNRLPPTQDAAGAGPQATWEAWVAARLARDWWEARRACDAGNAAVTPGAPPTAGLEPPLPGPAPTAMVEAAGNPPPLAAPVTPVQHRVTFGPGDAYTYTDNRLFDTRPRFAYYRSAHGVVFFGTPLREAPAAELDALFSETGMAPFEQRVMRAVSALEGGFEAVNTYDTGSVSVGFIQFVTMADGTHSLLDVLRRHKADRPADFEDTFRRFGIDASSDGVLVVVDPRTGAELVGEQAVRRVIEDKRLIAVFQRAGTRSRAFRVAQILVARSRYWPADDPISVKIGDVVLEGKASDVVRSEAGMATLFDRKVNRGSIAPFNDVAARIAAARGARTLAELAAFERDIVRALKYRTDFLATPALGQPAEPPAR